MLLNPLLAAQAQRQALQAIAEAGSFERAEFLAEQARKNARTLHERHLAVLLLAGLEQVS